IPANAFSDDDGDALTYTASLGDGSALPGWLTFNAATRTFSGTPPANFNGQIALKVTAGDGLLTASDVFALAISPQSDVPVVTASDQSLHHNEWHRVKDWFSATDPDGNAIAQYRFWDSGTTATSGYFWTPDNAHHAADTAITVDAAHLDDVWFRGG